MTSPAAVCVIGAGLSGLTSIKHLVDRGRSVVCFEIGSDIGGNWRYNNDNGRSAAYASLQIDTSKGRFAYADLDMDPSIPNYPHHSQVLEYLESYASEFDLRDAIVFRTEVVRVVPTDDGWDVTTRQVDTQEVETNRFAAVVVANGHHWKANVPDLDGDFSGDLIHAQDYRTPEPFIGKDVIVVGVGNTGVDLAAELTWHADSVTLSARSGAHVFPRYLFGRPLDAWSTPSASKLPLGVQRTVYSALLFAARGRQQSYGFPAPDTPILSQHPTVNQDILRLVKEGNVEVARGISRTSGETVVFSDGEEQRCDTIIFATGYELSFPFLDDNVMRVHDNVVPLYKRVVPPDLPGLYFVGLIQPVGALPPLAEQQARWVAQLVDGAALPTKAQMRAEIDRDAAAVSERYQERPRHTIQVDYWDYLEEMRALCDANDNAAIDPQDDLPADG
ncbi:MAG: flavin-containing monooxygenase [Acidimicrobiia bacterium]